jgi:drug/metabolite transporter (DMT)-like permease
VTALETGIAAAVGCSVLWAVLDVLRKQLAARFDPLGLTFWLAIGQAPFLAPWVLTTPGATTAGAIEAAYWPWAAASIACNIVAAMLYLMAVGSGQFGVAIPMLAFVPVWTAVLGWIVLGQAITATQAIGIATVVMGAIVLQSSGRRGIDVVAALVRERTSLLMLGVAFGWACTIVLDRRATGHAPLSVHALGLSLGIAIGATAWLAYQRRLGAIATSARAPWHLLAAALVAAGAMALQLAAMQSISVAALEAIKRTLGMAAAVILGRLVFREAITPHKVVAVAMMATGTLLVLRGLV